MLWHWDFLCCVGTVPDVVTSILYAAHVSILLLSSTTAGIVWDKKCSTHPLPLVIFFWVISTITCNACYSQINIFPVVNIDCMILLSHSHELFQLFDTN